MSLEPFNRELYVSEPELREKNWQIYYSVIIREEENETITALTWEEAYQKTREKQLKLKEKLEQEGLSVEADSDMITVMESNNDT